jgi:hypothetical protein
MDTIIWGGGRGANFCHLVTKTNSNVSSMMDFCEGKKNERLQILKIFLFLKLPYLDNKFPIGHQRIA